MYSTNPHMYPREDTLKRRTCICTREDTLLGEHMPYVDAKAHARTPQATLHVNSREDTLK